MSLTLHGVALSPFVRKVRVVLAEKQLAYQMKTVVPYMTREEYAEINPLRRVPALQDGDTTLADSAVIAHYLDAKYPVHPLMPEAIDGRARCEWLEKFGDYELAQNATFALFYQTLVAPTLGKQTDHAVVEKALNHTLPPLLDYLEQQLTDREWLVDNRFGLADIAIASQLINMGYAGYPLDDSRWPQLASHLNRCCARPSFAELLPEEQQVLGKLKAR
ncbi:glutathione S-transferase family protein [Marinobacterium arenosum]|uniref:glutathione S-transferase family protein n=1 Tax=Marinobacterium arenosum TaxID=2862496 RepID=UPI001C95B5A5|nr:glutathione S-transferase family protein [Marinobacterium arenosum]MBY4675436.1 glutathione S-transferase family protein [Marinobacterium arenosum]